MSECTCPCPTCDDEHSATLMEMDEARHMQRSLECDLADLRAALEAAQDEIEARILASERDRELIRQLGVVVDHMAPAAYKAIMAAGGVV